jgi:hypothetical protein
MARWFVNQEAKSSKGRLNPPPATKPAKKPRATNAEDLFAAEHRENINAALKLRLEQEDIGTKGGNLILHRVVKQEMFAGLSEADQLKYKAAAEEYNRKIQQPPPLEHIFEYVFLRTSPVL